MEKKVHVLIEGLDCAACIRSVEQAIAASPGFKPMHSQIPHE